LEEGSAIRQGKKNFGARMRAASVIVTNSPDHNTRTSVKYYDNLAIDVLRWPMPLHVMNLFVSGPTYDGYHSHNEERYRIKLATECWWVMRFSLSRLAWPNVCFGVRGPEYEGIGFGATVLSSVSIARDLASECFYLAQEEWNDMIVAEQRNTGTGVLGFLLDGG
jgi:hypothetical protein